MTDLLNRIQADSLSAYIGLREQEASVVEEPDTGFPPRGLTDDEELSRLGYADEDIRNVEAWLNSDGPGYGT